MNKKRDDSINRNNDKKEDAIKAMKTLSDRSVTGLFLAGTVVSLFLIAAVFAFGPGLAQARGPFGPARSADQVLEQMKERLSLTEEQAAAIQPIIEDKVNRMNEIRENAGTDRRGVRTIMQRIRWDTQVKLNEFLTDEQVDKYLQLRQEQRRQMPRGKFRGGKMRGGWMSRGANRTPGQVMERLNARLDLTEEQSAALEPIIRESIDKRRAVFDKYREQGQNVRQSIRAEMQSIGDETHDRMAAILTEEQIKELDDIREVKRARMDKRMNRPGTMGY